MQVMHKIAILGVHEPIHEGPRQSQTGVLQQLELRFIILLFHCYFKITDSSFAFTHFFVVKKLSRYRFARPSDSSEAITWFADNSASRLLAFARALLALLAKNYFNY